MRQPKPSVRLALRRNLRHPRLVRLPISTGEGIAKCTGWLRYLTRQHGRYKLARHSALLTPESGGHVHRLIAHNKLSYLLPIRHRTGSVGERCKHGGFWPRVLPNYLKVETVMKTELQTALLSGALVLGGWVATVDPAASAVYRGRFDPVYGIPFQSPALGWAGSVEIAVNDSCLASNPSSLDLLTCAGGIRIEIVQAFADLFEVNSSGDMVGVIQQTMNFVPSSGILGLNWNLTFDTTTGNLTGARSTAFAAQQGAAGELTRWEEVDSSGNPLKDSAGNPINQGQAWFSAQFLGTYAQLYWFNDQPTAAELVQLTDPLRFNGDCRVNGIKVTTACFFDPNKCGWSDPDGISTTGAFIEWSRVSEPATFALVPAALAIMGLVGLGTRRRHLATLPQ